MQARGTRSTFQGYAAMASRKGLVSESEPAIERTGTGQKRLFVATRKFWSQRESHSPEMNANKIAAAFPPAIEGRSDVKYGGASLARRRHLRTLRLASQSSASK